MTALRTMFVMDDGTLYMRGEITVAEEDLGAPDWFARSVSRWVADLFADLADLAEVGAAKPDHDVTASGTEAAIHLANWVQMFAPVDWTAPRLAGGGVLRGRALMARVWLCPCGGEVGHPENCDRSPTGACHKVILLPEDPPRWAGELGLGLPLPRGVERERCVLPIVYGMIPTTRFEARMGWHHSGTCRGPCHRGPACGLPDGHEGECTPYHVEGWPEGVWHDVEGPDDG